MELHHRRTTYRQPIRGPEGNIEYLGFLQKGAETTAAFDLDALVEESHQTLKEHGEGTV